MREWKKDIRKAIREANKQRCNISINKDNFYSDDDYIKEIIKYKRVVDIDIQSNTIVITLDEM